MLDAGKRATREGCEPRAVPDHAQRVVAGRADDIERIAVSTAVDHIGAVAQGVDESVEPGVAVQDVIASAACQRVVAGSATDEVVAAAGVDGVVAALAIDDVDAAVDRDGVVALAADEVLDAG